MKITAGKKKKRPISKLASHAYSKNRIAKNAAEGSHNGDSMEYVFNKIMNDPDITIGEPDARGNQSIFYRDQDIGWMNPNRGIGWIDDKAYDKLQDYVEPEEDEDFDDDDAITSAIKIKKKKVGASGKIETEDDLRAAIKEALTAEVCAAIVNLAYSEDNYFDEDIFIDSETFFDTSIGNEESKEVALKFFNGEDLDSKGPANPNRDYFRFDGYGNIESTNDPNEIYLGELDVEAVDYVMDHLDDREYPEQIQELVDKFLGNTEA